MKKLKTAKEVRKEIFSKYFEPGGYVPSGLAVYRGTVPSLRKEACFNERDCIEVIKTKDDILDEVLHDYFKSPTEKGIYMDFADNVYRNKMEALNSINKGLYNWNKSKRKDSDEVSLKVSLNG